MYLPLTNIWRESTTGVLQCYVTCSCLYLWHKFRVRYIEEKLKTQQKAYQFNFLKAIDNFLWERCTIDSHIILKDFNHKNNFYFS